MLIHDPEDPYSHLPNYQEGKFSAKKLGLYFAVFLVVLLAVGSAPTWYYQFKNDPVILYFDSAEGKLTHLKKFHADTEVILWGDSRSYIGSDPLIIGQELGKKAFNYASMAHWFHTQYPQLKQMLPHMKGKKVVWMIGKINFVDGLKLNDQFYLSPVDAFEYYNLGFRVEDLGLNVVNWALPRHFVYFVRGTVQYKVESLKNRVLWKKPIQKQAQSAAPAKQSPLTKPKAKPTQNFEAKYQEARSLYPDFVKMTVENGQKKSNIVLTVHTAKGHNPFIELDSVYLRQRQAEWDTATEPGAKPKANPALEEIYTRMLELFKKHEIELTILEYRDAPYQTKFALSKKYERELMDKYKLQAENMGFPYLVLDMEEFKDEDYFDYNHLNAQGSKRFSKMVGERLRNSLHFQN